MPPSATSGRSGTSSLSARNATGLQSRPVVNLSFALDYVLGGLDTLPYHLTNLAIHLLATLALFGIVHRTLLLPAFRNRFGQAAVPLALAVALLWAVHPLQTESVTYVTQRYESLMGLFYLLAVYSLVRCGSSPIPIAGARLRHRPRCFRWARKKWRSPCRSQSSCMIVCC